MPNWKAITYDLDFTETVDLANASTTYGIRAGGAIPVINDKTNFIYTAEFATQSDTGSNPNNYDANYYLGGAGFKLKLDSFITSILAKASYEVLESDQGTQGDSLSYATGNGSCFPGLDR